MKTKPQIYLSVTKTGIYIDFVDIKTISKVEYEKKLLSEIKKLFEIVK
jgi:hypothetical protein